MFVDVVYLYCVHSSFFFCNPSIKMLPHTGANTVFRVKPSDPCALGVQANALRTSIGGIGRGGNQNANLERTVPGHIAGGGRNALDGAIFARDPSSRPSQELSSNYMLAVGGNRNNPYHRPRDATQRTAGPSGGTINPHATAMSSQVTSMQQSYATALATQQTSRTGGLTKYD